MKSPIPLEDFERSATGVEVAVTLPPAAYTSAAFYEFEREAVWARGWICVGRVEQTPAPGDFRTVELFDAERVVVERTDAGAIRATPVVVHRRGVDYSDVPVPELAVEVWQGFVFVNLDPNASPLAPTLTKADAVLANYHLDEMLSTDHEALRAMPFNWKLMVENFMEGYHNNRLHHDLYDIARGDDPVQETSLKGRKVHVTGPSDGILLAAARTAFKDRGLNPTQRALFPPIPTLTDDEHWQMVVFFVPPSLLSIVSTDSALWFVVTPKGPETLDMTMSYVHPPASKGMKLFDPLFAQQLLGVENFNEEDIPANVATQVGLRSRFAPRGLLAKGDLFLAEFSQWLLPRYREADADTALAQ